MKLNCLLYLVFTLHQAGRPFTDTGLLQVEGDTTGKWNPKNWGNHAGDIANAAKNTFNKGKDTVSNSLKNGADKVSDIASGVGDKLSDVKGSISNAKKKVSDTVKGNVIKVSQKTKNRAKEIQKEVQKGIKALEGALDDLTDVERYASLYATVKSAVDSYADKVFGGVPKALKDAGDGVKGFATKAKGWAVKKRDDLKDVRDEIKTASRQLVDTISDVTNKMARGVVKAVIENAVAFNRVVIDTIRWIAKVYGAWQLTKIHQCIADNGTEGALLLFGEVARTLLNPSVEIADMGDDAEEAGKAAEATVLEELACGFGDVALYTNITGPARYAMVRDLGMEWDTFVKDWNELEEVMKGDCSHESYAAGVWNALKNGFPAHCAALFANPARDHAGTYKVEYSKSIYNNNYTVKMNCMGYVYAGTGSGFVGEPLTSDEELVKEKCHEHNPEADFFITQIYTFVPGDRAHCLHVDGDNMVGKHVFNASEWSNLTYRRAEKDDCAVLPPPPLEAFDKVEDRCIRGYNNVTVIGITLEDCASLCNDNYGFETGHQCNSIEYIPKKTIYSAAETCAMGSSKGKENPGCGGPPNFPGCNTGDLYKGCKNHYGIEFYVKKEIPDHEED